MRIPKGIRIKTEYWEEQSKETWIKRYNKIVMFALILAITNFAYIFIVGGFIPILILNLIYTLILATIEISSRKRGNAE